jgi:outer membrane protein assembly factor BamD (BamD/ComL family)
MKHGWFFTALLALTAIWMGCGPSFDLSKAEKLMEKGNWGEADRILDDVIQSHSGSKWGQKALMLKGCALFRRSKLQEAEEALLSARDMMPEGEWADDCDYYLARVLFTSGDHAAAANGFRRVLTNYGDDPDLSNWKLRAMEELEYLQKTEESP